MSNILKQEQLRELILYSVKSDKEKAKTKLSFKLAENDFEDTHVNTLIKEQFAELAGEDHLTFKKNEIMIFELMQEAIDEVLPKRVFDALNIFAEFRTVKEGDKVTFTQPTGRIRGRNFITRVAHAGSYEVFQMDRRILDMPVTAYGGAVKIQFEEMLEGRIDFPELIQAVTEGYEEAIYREILLQMLALHTQSILPTNNKRALNGFAPRAFTALTSITRAYGEPTIFCSEVFAGEILPEGHMITESQKEKHASQGHLGSWNGANVVVLPYSFYDTSNEAAALTLPAGLAWILPSGKDKPVKIVFEGKTHLRPTDTMDWGKKIDAYKKMGIMLISNPGMTVYHNKALDTWPEVDGPIVNMPNGEITDVKYTRLV